MIGAISEEAREENYTVEPSDERKETGKTCIEVTLSEICQKKKMNKLLG